MKNFATFSLLLVQQTKIRPKLGTGFIGIFFGFIYWDKVHWIGLSRV